MKSFWRKRARIESLLAVKGGVSRTNGARFGAGVCARNDDPDAVASAMQIAVKIAYRFMLSSGERRRFSSPPPNPKSSLRWCKLPLAIALMPDPGNIIPMERLSGKWRRRRAYRHKEVGSFRIS